MVLLNSNDGHFAKQCRLLCTAIAVPMHFKPATSVALNANLGVKKTLSALFSVGILPRQLHSVASSFSSLHFFRDPFFDQFP